MTDWDPFELVPCRCVHAGTPGLELHRNDRGAEVTRACRECHGNPGRRLRGNPPGDQYELVLDFTGQGPPPRITEEGR